MVKVNYSNNVKRGNVIVDSSTTLRQVLTDVGVSYTSGTVHLDGCPLRPGDMDKTFESLGIQEECWLTNVVKADNAIRTQPERYSEVPVFLLLG